MSDLIYCVKLKKQGVPLKFAPYPGELGQKILKSVSQEAWNLWLKQQTILINEYRLNTLDLKARTMLRESLEKFLFEDQEILPPRHPKR